MKSKDWKEEREDFLFIMKRVRNPIELQVLILGLERIQGGVDAGIAYDTLLDNLLKEKK